MREFHGWYHFDALLCEVAYEEPGAISEEFLIYEEDIAKAKSEASLRMIFRLKAMEDFMSKYPLIISPDSEKLFIKWAKRACSKQQSIGDRKLSDARRQKRG